MARRREKKNIAEEKNDKENELGKKLEELTKELYYTSETDEKIVPYFGEKVELLTTEEVLKANSSPSNTQVIETDVTELFEGLTAIQDWYGEEEKATAEKFAELAEVLKSNLRELKLYKVGKIEVDIYIIGLNDENYIEGVKTKAVET